MAAASQRFTMQCHYLFALNIGMYNFTTASYGRTIPMLYTAKRGHANTALRLVMPERVVSTLRHRFDAHAVSVLGTAFPRLYGTSKNIALPLQGVDML